MFDSVFFFSVNEIKIKSTKRCAHDRSKNRGMGKGRLDILVNLYPKMHGTILMDSPEKRELVSHSHKCKQTQKKRDTSGEVPNFGA